MRELTERVFIEDGDLLPFRRIVERVRVDPGKLVAIPGHGLGQRKCLLLSLALYVRDLRA